MFRKDVYRGQQCKGIHLLLADIAEVKGESRFQTRVSAVFFDFTGNGALLPILGSVHEKMSDPPRIISCSPMSSSYIDL